MNNQSNSSEYTFEDTALWIIEEAVEELKGLKLKVEEHFELKNQIRCKGSLIITGNNEMLESATHLIKRTSQYSNHFKIVPKT